MSGVGHVRFLDARGLQRHPDRLKELLAVLLDQRLQERHPEHLTFPFVDAWGEVLVDVVSKVMPVQEGPSAVSLHEEFNSGFLL